MKVKLTLLAVLAALIAFGAAQLAPADTGTRVPTAKKRVQRGPRGPRGRRGPRGPQGPSGFGKVVTVEGATVTFPPGGFGGVPSAQCPSGMVVVGTGFNGPFDAVGGFVKAYGTFVGGFFENESSIPLDANVQAICAETSSATASASSAGQSAQYEHEVKRAEQLAAASS